MRRHFKRTSVFIIYKMFLPKSTKLAKNQLTNLIHEFHKLSTRKASSAIRLSFGCVRSFVREDLHSNPHTEHEYHLLMPAEYAKTVEFGENFIDMKKWPPRYPNFNTCDFFLWEYLKQRVYHPLPKSIQDMKNNIKREYW